MGAFAPPCPGALWNRLCWPVTQRYPGPGAPALAVLTPPREGPLLHACFLQIMSSWVSDLIPNSQAGAFFSWRWRSRSDGSLPRPVPICSNRPAAQRGGAATRSRALVIRAAEPALRRWLTQNKSKRLGALWLTACSFWRAHCDFWQRKEGIRTKQGKEEFVISFHQPSLCFLLPRM